MKHRTERIIEKMSTFRFIFFVLLTGFNLQAQADPAITYSAHSYLQFEQTIEDSLKRGSFEKLNKLLSADYTFHRPSLPNLNKQEWLAAKSAGIHQEWQIQDIEVQTFNSINVVSFIRRSTTSSEQQFIVDIWSNTQEKLLSRYESLLRPSTASPPSGPRPNGRG